MLLLLRCQNPCWLRRQQECVGICDIADMIAVSLCMCCYTSVLFAIRWMERVPHSQPVPSFGPDRNAAIVPWDWRGHQLLLSFLFWLMLLWWYWCIITPNMGNDVNAYWLCFYSVCSCQFSSIIQQAWRHKNA